MIPLLALPELGPDCPVPWATWEATLLQDDVHKVVLRAWARGHKALAVAEAVLDVLARPSDEALAVASLASVLLALRCTVSHTAVQELLRSKGWEEEGVVCMPEGFEAVPGAHTLDVLKSIAYLYEDGAVSAAEEARAAAVEEEEEF